MPSGPPNDERPPSSGGADDAMRTELFAWFCDRAPSLAPAYAGAIRLLAAPEFPGRVHFISHAVRDICDRLARALNAEVTFPRVQYEDGLDEVSMVWPRSLPGGASPDAASNEVIALPVAAARLVHDLVAAHRERQTRPDAYELLFRQLMQIEPEGASVNERLVESFRQTRKWFMRLAHARHDKEPEVEESELRRRFADFELMLHGFAGRFHTTATPIDAALERANAGALPPEAELLDIVPRLAAPEAERRFFRRLTNPAWIEPLEARGFFRNPPPPERRGSGVRYRGWHQLEYLARMAPMAPQMVVDVLRPIEVSNYAIAMDVLKVVKALPAEHATALVPMLGKGIREAGVDYLLEDVGELVVSLVAADQFKAAVRLAELAFDAGSWLTVRDSQWDRTTGYLAALERHVIPALIDRCARRLIDLLWTWTKAWARHESPTGEDRHSNAWRPEIAAEPTRPNDCLASVMVSLLKDVLDRAIASGKVTLADALTSLRPGESPRLTERFRLYLLAEYGEQDPDQTAAALMDDAAFSDPEFRSEYAHLVERRFSHLTDEQQTSWLERVEVGPGASAVRDRVYGDDQGRRKIAEDRWRGQRLHWARAYLTGKWRDLYERIGTEDRLDDEAMMRSSRRAFRIHDQSPYSLDQLRAITPNEVIAILNTWRPTDDAWGEVTAEELARVFGHLVASNAREWSSLGGELALTPAVYLEVFVRAMVVAVGKNEPVHLGPILTLCAAVARRPIDFQAGDAAFGSDTEHGWRLCRREIAGLIETVCSAGMRDERPTVGMEHRDAIWAALEPLVLEPSDLPVVADGPTDVRVRDWTMVALNSLRAKAVAALIVYARWIQIHTAAAQPKAGAARGGLRGMPEVEAALDAQLEPPLDGFAARAAFGMKLGALLRLDSDWITKRAAHVFDLAKIESEPHAAFGWAAWIACMFSHSPHIAIVRLLSPQFAYALEQAETVDESADHVDRSYFIFVEHLIDMYAVGRFGENPREALASQDGIITRLSTQAPEWLRIKAMEFAGRALGAEPTDLPPGAVERLQVLWDTYWTAVGEGDARRNPSRRTFGWWFASGAFDPTWSLDRLNRLVSIDPKAEPHHLIMRRLAKVYSADLPRSVRIVEALVNGDVEGWRVSSWKNEAKVVLQAGLKASPDVRLRADLVVDRLIRRGYDEFADLQ